MTEEENEKSELEEFKERYLEYQKKFDLPSFEFMNENFNIEKICGKETDFFIREIRRIVGDQIVGYMRLCEGLINPSNSPMFVFSIVKTFKETEKEKVKEAYKNFSKLEIDFIQLDLKYDEKLEVKFIKETSKLWESFSKDFFELFELVKSRFNEKIVQNGKGYFG